MSEGADSIATAILRFRDLVTGPGGTIENHKKIADEKKTVWWGWWSKSGEKIPDDAFRQLSKLSKSDKGLELLLFDSGRLKIFHTVCSEIKWDAEHNRIPTPDGSLTPDYYHNQEYLAWFKLSSFKEIGEKELKSFSYFRVDNFFTGGGESRFKSFYNKQVSGVSELAQQNRSMWFVRPFKKGDHTHVIELLDIARFSPSDFPSEHIVSKSRNLVWVSDLHFGSKHGFPPRSIPGDYDLGQAIEVAVTKHNLSDYAALLVSGDITWKAAPEEFKEAREFLKRLAQSPSPLTNHAILLCPGNHDLAFTETPEDKSAKIHAIAAPETARKAYTDFYEELFYKQPNEYISCGRRLLIGGCIPVEIVSLNSSLLDQKEDWFQGHGFIGDPQLQHAAKEMGWNVSDEPKAFRILMLHHHLMPVTFRETPVGGYPYSVALDAEAVVQWVVEHRVDLVLHGHMHKSFIARVERPIGNDPSKKWHAFHVAGLSSTGVAKSHAEGGNAFAVLTFSHQEVLIRWFSIHSKETSAELWNLKIPFVGSRP